MNNLENVRQLALESLDKYKGLPVKNISSLVESELTFWETSLFPIYDSLYLPRYQTLIDDFLVKAGFDVSVKKLTNTVFYVKEKRKKKAIKGGVSLPAAGGVPGVVVQPIGSVVSVAQSNPSLGSVPSVQPVNAPIVPVAPSGMSWVYPKVSKVQPIEIESWEAEEKRLRKEKFGEIDGWDVWNGKDEYLWIELLKEIDKFNKIQPKQSYMWRHDNYVQFKQSIKKDEQLTNIYELLMSKLKNPIREI